MGKENYKRLKTEGQEDLQIPLDILMIWQCLMMMVNLKEVPGNLILQNWNLKFRELNLSSQRIVFNIFIFKLEITSLNLSNEIISPFPLLECSFYAAIFFLINFALHF